jgi:hypothetical protein
MPDPTQRLAHACYFNQILFLCEREQKVPDQTEIGHIRTWIGSATAA